MACDISEILGGFIKRLVDVSQRFGQMESQEDVVVAAETFLTKLDKLISMLELLPDTSDDPPPPAKRQKKTATITKTATAATITKATATSTPTRPRRQSAGRRKIQKQSEEIEISSGLHEVEDDSDVLVKTEPSSSSFLDEPVGEIANEDYKVVKADIMEEGDDREDHDDGDDGDYGNDGDDGDYGDDGDDANDANDGDDNNDNLEDDAVEDEHPSDVKDTSVIGISEDGLKIDQQGHDVDKEEYTGQLNSPRDRNVDENNLELDKLQGKNTNVKLCQATCETVCDICDKRFLTVERMRRHTKFVHEPVFNYKCATCGKQFRSNSHFQRHIKVHQASEKSKYYCSKCNKTYVSQLCFQKHQKRCGGNEKIKCDMCESTFGRAENLREHQMSKHSGITYTCTCGKTYPWRFSFVRHLSKCQVNT